VSRRTVVHQWPPSPHSEDGISQLRLMIRLISIKELRSSDKRNIAAADFSNLDFHDAA